MSDESHKQRQCNKIIMAVGLLRLPGLQNRKFDISETVGREILPPMRETRRWFNYMTLH